MIERLAIERVQVALDRRLADTRSQLRRHEAERDDAQRRGEELELGMPGHARGEVRGEPHVVGNHAPVARRARMPEREPDLERAKTPRVLRAVVHVVQDALVEPVVGRLVGERRAQSLRIADERAPGLERGVEPLVRVHRDGVRLGEAAKIVRGLRHRGRERAVSPVHVEPELLPSADFGDPR